MHFQRFGVNRVSSELGKVLLGDYLALRENDTECLTRIMKPYKSTIGFLLQNIADMIILRKQTGQGEACIHSGYFHKIAWQT